MWTALASCPARQGQRRSLRKMCKVLSWAFTRGAKPGMRLVGLLLEGGFTHPVRGADVLLAKVALVAQHDQAGYRTVTNARMHARDTSLAQRGC